jgi:hypothetical protein
LSSNNKTSRAGATWPPRMSQEVTARSSPSARNDVFGTPPVAITTTSGASARTSAAGAKRLQRRSTPRRRVSSSSQSTMPMISRRRANAAARRTWDFGDDVRIRHMRPGHAAMSIRRSLIA